MANFFQFKTVFVVFVLLFSANVRANAGDFTTFPAENLEVCDAPPPDSFRVTSIGSTFVTLAWTPAWQGALHFIELKKQDGNGNWNADRIFYDVPGAGIFIDSLEAGQKYQASIATKCIDGGVGILSPPVEIISLIVDLTIVGRVPKDPKPILCENIPYNNYEWLGFRVSRPGQSSMFEVRIPAGGYPYAYIDRVLPMSGNIVATNSSNTYPNAIQPIVFNVTLPFQVTEEISFGNFVPIGFINVEKTSILGQVNICPVPNKPWNSIYTFNMLYADELAEALPGTERPSNPEDKLTNNKIRAQSPFKDNLTLFIPDYLIGKENFSIRIWDLNNRQRFNYKFDYLDSQISLSLNNLTQGIYFLEICSDEFHSLLKVLKQ